MSEIKITIEQLERLLNQQKELVIERLVGQSGYYNLESDNGNYRTLPIDKVKFKEYGMRTSFPDDLIILKKYLH